MRRGENYQAQSGFWKPASSRSIERHFFIKSMLHWDLWEFSEKEGRGEGVFPIPIDILHCTAQLEMVNKISIFFTETQTWGEFP